MDNTVEIVNIDDISEKIANDFADGNLSVLTIELKSPLNAELSAQVSLNGLELISMRANRPMLSWEDLYNILSKNEHSSSLNTVKKTLAENIFRKKGEQKIVKGVWTLDLLWLGGETAKKINKMCIEDNRLRTFPLVEFVDNIKYGDLCLYDKSQQDTLR